MPQIRTATVKQWMLKSEEIKSRCIPKFKIKNEEVFLYLVDNQEGIKKAFITNFYIPEQIAHHLYSLYSKRWGIETKYRQIEDFKARTTTTNYKIRLFYFLFSTCLFNLWVLVNICISMILYGRIKEKPLVSLKLFAIVLYRVYVDSGG